MAKDFYDELAKIMREHGCSRVEGGKGSHEKWKSPIKRPNRHGPALEKPPHR